LCFLKAIISFLLQDSQTDLNPALLSMRTFYCLLAAYICIGRSVQGAGIILEKTNPWDTAPSSVQQFQSILPRGTHDTGYREYFAGRDGRKFSVEKDRIIRLIFFSDHAEPANITDESALNTLSAERNDLLEVSKKFSIAKPYVAPQISFLDEQIEKFRSGFRKVNARWLTAIQYREYVAGQEKLVAEERAAEEKRRGEQKAAEEKQLASIKTEQQRYKAEQERLEAELHTKLDGLKARKRSALEVSKLARDQARQAKHESDELETQAAAIFPALPKIRISGQVFLATRGAGSYKFGAITLGVFSRESVDRVMLNCGAFAKSIFQASEAWEEADKEERKLNSASPGPDGASPNLFPSTSWLGSGALYFHYLPKPLKTAETDADGNFQIEVPTGGNYVIGASSRRVLGEKLEYYYWLVPIGPSAKTEARLLLSNNNLSSGTDSDSLIRTIEVPDISAVPWED
jgi:hypothetical protein